MRGKASYSHWLSLIFVALYCRTCRRFKGFGFIEFHSPASAHAAVAAHASSSAGDTGGGTGAEASPAVSPARGATRAFVSPDTGEQQEEEDESMRRYSPDDAEMRTFRYGDDVRGTAGISRNESTRISGIHKHRRRGSRGDAYSPSRSVANERDPARPSSAAAPSASSSRIPGDFDTSVVSPADDGASTDAFGRTHRLRQAITSRGGSHDYVPEPDGRIIGREDEGDTRDVGYRREYSPSSAGESSPGRHRSSRRRSRSYNDDEHDGDTRDFAPDGAPSSASSNGRDSFGRERRIYRPDGTDGDYDDDDDNDAGYRRDYSPARDALAGAGLDAVSGLDDRVRHDDHADSWRHGGGGRAAGDQRVYSPTEGLELTSDYVRVSAAGEEERAYSPSRSVATNENNDNDDSGRGSSSNIGRIRRRDTNDYGSDEGSESGFTFDARNGGENDNEEEDSHRRHRRRHGSSDRNGGGGGYYPSSSPVASSPGAASASASGTSFTGRIRPMGDDNHQSQEARVATVPSFSSDAAGGDAYLDVGPDYDNRRYNSHDDGYGYDEEDSRLRRRKRGREDDDIDDGSGFGESPVGERFVDDEDHRVSDSDHHHYGRGRGGGGERKRRRRHSVEQEEDEYGRMRSRSADSYDERHMAASAAETSFVDERFVDSDSETGSPQKQRQHKGDSRGSGSGARGIAVTSARGDDVRSKPTAEGDDSDEADGGTQRDFDGYGAWLPSSAPSARPDGKHKKKWMNAVRQDPAAIPSPEATSPANNAPPPPLHSAAAAEVAPPRPEPMVVMMKADWLALKEQVKAAMQEVKRAEAAAAGMVEAPAQQQQQQQHHSSEPPVVATDNSSGRRPPPATAPPASPDYQPGLLVHLSPLPLAISFRHLRDIAQVPGRPRYVDCPEIYHNGVLDSRPLSAAARAGHVPESGFPSTSSSAAAGSDESSPAGFTEAIVRYFTPAEAQKACAYFTTTPVLVCGQRVTAQPITGKAEAQYWRDVAEKQREYQAQKEKAQASSAAHAAAATAGRRGHRGNLKKR